MGTTKKILQNETASLGVDIHGGAIIDFHLHSNKINPLTFCFSKEQMPENNREGAPYQGHFLCLGRWGEPSAGELKAGLPDHGQIANILWDVIKEDTRNFKMVARSQLEGLQIERTIQMDDLLPAYLVTEYVTNINPLGRLYNMVQHPTIAAPFLNNDTIVNCNAASGFNYRFFKEPEQHLTQWPHGTIDDVSFTDISTSSAGPSTVFSFIVNRQDNIGWVTAYAPANNLLFGYLWKRSDYPWVNLWLHYEDRQIRFRGLEFGTSGIHQPFHQILKNGNGRVLGEKTFDYIDAGETVLRSYLSFLYEVEPGFTGVQSISMANGRIEITYSNNNSILLNTVFEDLK